ncbi:Uncharacterized protein Fot_49567 [Forsythia ovata]|uniref:Uncharacterized protein n=1 Tax=Forsythia ovata TaxID=205694 RepID=A0ABD1QGD7_9LAMI
MDFFTAEMVVSVRADLQRERAAHSEEPAPHRERESPAAATRKWCDFVCEEGPPRRDLERERAAHSEEAGPQREESHRRRRLGLQWWEFQREEGPPRGDPQLDWGVHSEGSRPKARERSPPVAMAFSGGGFGVRRRSRWGGGFLGHEIGDIPCGR